ncbi:MAG: polysaccharide biosynthesis/export family protein, partial [Acidobacteria bacterium]|nr:polysaccharide biosynthesis/export family protein [Acidobacteriota bacterium]
AARAQRVGPVEDERAATDAAKNAVEKTDAKSADKSAPKTEANKTETKKTTSDAKLDHTSANAASSPSASSPTSNASTTTPAASPSPAAASPTPSTATTTPSTAAAATPLGEKTASSGTSDAKPDPATQAAPANTLPSMGALPPPPTYESPQPLKADVPATQAANSPANAASSVAVPPSAIYRVGAGDILDIRLVGGMSRDITLFTVLANGTIDYPLAGEPVAVLGLTTDEIGARLSAALKRRGIFDRAQFQIGVRDYASHTVMVSGLVDQPGQKALQREAVPLYVVFAQALPRPDAGRVVVVSRATGRTRTLDLSDPAALNELVSNGDVITVQPRPQEFYYIAGEINAAGQKDYHTGITLTQAILAAGGVTRAAGKRTVVVVSRQGADGRLVPVEYVLQEIEDGKVPDPRIQPGDRIEVGRRR